MFGRERRKIYFVQKLYLLLCFFSLLLLKFCCCMIGTAVHFDGLFAVSLSGDEITFSAFIQIFSFDC